MSGLSSGEVVVGGVAGQGWWLVAAEEGDPGRVVAGPFAQRAEASWAAGAYVDGAVPVAPVYGTGTAEGVLRRRPSPQDWAWLAHLGGQLDRLPEDWDVDLSDDDPLATLVVEVTAALAEAGLPLHDSTGEDGGLGGACLTPEPALDGIVVTWRQHDRMSVDQVHGTAADVLVQQVMNRALADVLTLRGFGVEAFGGATGHVVRWAA
ncbi:hypothetical protein GCU56_17810 [Geodermatophilus sabuli]|uniref:Uncharacterized protein n=1 Tax=Geodermatophilus sabuli TaxID=1564158 RepID=A0A7K3W794_9ACTN|nr:hypothetical protein [Geodermatophilus sabuli]NEK59717.1 hypothetical protein [Geodermatophilus sabuli]